MTPGNHRKIRKIIVVLNQFKYEYAKENDISISSKFGKASEILGEILREEKIDGYDN